MIRQTWHVDKRNVKKGDIVLVGDSNQMRGTYRLAEVNDVYPDERSKVRTVDVRYKNFSQNEPIGEYDGKDDTVVSRPVQQLVVLLPVDEEEPGVNTDEALVEFDFQNVASEVKKFGPRRSRRLQDKKD